MMNLRKNIFKVLLILACIALPGADIECEDDELEINWPDIEIFDDHHHDGVIFVEDCCWW